jgi:DNA-binding transcriptional MerR regulator
LLGTRELPRVEEMGIGEFSRRSRLSQKALRLYDDLGILPPTRVDSATAYRYYSEDQLEVARTVAQLRHIGVPLSEVKVIVDLDAESAAMRVSRYWNATEEEHQARRQLARTLVERLRGEMTVMYDVHTRDIPERQILCLKRNVEGESGAWAFGKEFMGIMKAHQLPRVAPPVGAVFCIWHGLVNEDSDGPLEWCRPVPTDQAEELASTVPELTLRAEPGHKEAFVHIGKGGETSPARWELVSQSLQAWAQPQNLQLADLGVRITYEWSRPDPEDPEGLEPAGPDTDFAVPYYEASSQS